MDNNQKNTENLAVLLMGAKEGLLGFYRPVLNANGLTEQQWRVMRILAEDTQMDFQILADHACLLRPSLTGILNRLEGMQLIYRRKPALDQRRLLVALTDKGIKLHGQVIGQVQLCEQQFTHAFGAKNQEKLILLLNKMKALNVG